jgi:hypothetical protein
MPGFLGASSRNSATLGGKGNDTMDQVSLLLGVLFSAIGGGYFLYGRKQAKPLTLIVGLLLCVYPYFVSSRWMLFLVGVGLTLLPWALES